MADPITTSVVTTLATNAALQVAKQAQDFLSAVSGHKGESIGTIMGDLLKRRTENGEKVWSAAHLTLLNLNLHPDHIALPILQPAVEGSTLAEEPSLRQAWSNLLANASDPRHKTPVMAIFTSFLKDLGGSEVKFLDGLFEESLNRVRHHDVWKRVSQICYETGELQNLYAGFGLTRVSRLSGAGFEEQHRPEFEADMDAFWLSLGICQRHNILTQQVLEPEKLGFPSSREKLMRRWYFTDLGAAFVKACRPPSP